MAPHKASPKVRTLSRIGLKVGSSRKRWRYGQSPGERILEYLSCFSHLVILFSLNWSLMFLIENESLHALSTDTELGAVTSGGQRSNSSPRRGIAPGASSQICAPRPGAYSISQTSGSPHELWDCADKDVTSSVAGARQYVPPEGPSQPHPGSLAWLDPCGFIDITDHHAASSQTMLLGGPQELLLLILAGCL